MIWSLRRDCHDPGFYCYCYCYLLFYFETIRLCVTSCFSVSPGCFSPLSVFPFVTSSVLFPPLSPHLFLIPSLVCLCIQSLLSLMCLSLCSVTFCLTRVCFWFLLFVINLYCVFDALCLAFCYFGFCSFDPFFFSGSLCFICTSALVDTSHFLFPYFLPPACVTVLWVLINFYP